MKRYDYQESGGFDLKPGDVIYVCPSRWYDKIIEYKVMGVNGGKITLRDDTMFEWPLPIMNYSLDRRVIAKEKRRQIRASLRDLRKVASEAEAAVENAQSLLRKYNGETL